MDLENFHARLLIGQGDLNLTVQPGEVNDCCGEVDLHAEGEYFVKGTRACSMIIG